MLVVPPYIEIENVILNVTLGGYARLRCKFEAFPFGVYYWEDSRGIVYEESFDKFNVSYYNFNRYEVSDLCFKKIQTPHMILCHSNDSIPLGTHSLMKQPCKPLSNKHQD